MRTAFRAWRLHIMLKIGVKIKSTPLRRHGLAASSAKRKARFG